MLPSEDITYTTHNLNIWSVRRKKMNGSPDANSQLKAGTKILIRIRTEYNHRNDERIGRFIWRWTLITNGQERLRQPARLPKDDDVTKITDCTIFAISECVLAAVCFLTRVYTSLTPSEYLLNRTRWLACWQRTLVNPPITALCWAALANDVTD